MKRTGNSVEYVWFDGEIGEGYEKVTEFYVEGYIDGKNVSLSLNPDGPRPSWKQFLLEYEGVGLFLADNSDYIVKGYAIGETRAQWAERSRAGGVDMMPNQAFSVGLFFAGGGLGRLNRGYTPSVQTPYGPAFQPTSAEALAAREAVENGATLFRGES